MHSQKGRRMPLETESELPRPRGGEQGTLNCQSQLGDRKVDFCGFRTVIPHSPSLSSVLIAFTRNHDFVHPTNIQGALSICQFQSLRLHQWKGSQIPSSCGTHVVLEKKREISPQISKVISSSGKG